MSIRVPDLPVLGAPTDDSLIVGDHVGTGLFTGAAMRSYVLGSSSSAPADLTVTSVTTTGAADFGGHLTVDGGADITGNVAITGSTSTGPLSVTGDGSISGNVSIGGTLGVTGATTLDGHVGITDTVDITGDLDVTGNAAVSGNLTVNGTLGGVTAVLVDDGTFGLVEDGSGYRYLAWAGGYNMRWAPSDGSVTWDSPTGILMTLTSAGHLLLMGGNNSLGEVDNTYFTLNGGSDFSAGTAGKSSLIVNGGGRTPYGFEFYTNGTRYVAFDGSGAAYKPGGGSWADISDARTKQDVQDYTSGLDEVLQLRPVSYRFLQETGRDTSIVHYGLIAQEAEVPMPEMVRQGPADCGAMHFEDMRSLDTTALLFALVNACKTLADRVAALEAAPLRSQPPNV